MPPSMAAGMLCNHYGQIRLSFCDVGRLNDVPRHPIANNGYLTCGLFCWPSH